MNIKKFLNNLTYKNFRANIGMLLAFILILILISIKCFGHIELHADWTKEMDEVIKSEKEIQERKKEVKDKYDKRRENIQKWYKEDDYCDKDLKNRVLNKTKEQEDEELEMAKNPSYLG